MEIIESLRKQITELEKQLNIEKDQNQNLLKELQDLKDKIKLIQDLENKLEEEKNKNKILKDKHEKQKKRIYKNIKGLLKGYDIKQEAIQKIISKLTGQNKDIIKVNFISTDQQINCSLECNKKDKFKKIENLLYKKYTQYKESENDFISNDITLDKEKNLEENNIKDNNIIELKKIEKKDVLIVKFISTDQQINCTLVFNKNEKFNKLENLLYKQYPQFNDPKTYFIVNGIKVEKDKTLEENKIKNNDTIMVNKVNTTMLQ